MYTRERLTYSLHGTAYAVAIGIKLIRTFKEPGNKTTFVLDDTDGLASKALHDFWDGEPMVNARTFMEARRYLFETMDNNEANKENTTNAAVSATAE